MAKKENDQWFIKLNSHAFVPYPHSFLPKTIFP